jgi:hypothetical protein
MRPSAPGAGAAGVAHDVVAATAPLLSRDRHHGEWRRQIRGLLTHLYRHVVSRVLGFVKTRSILLGGRGSGVAPAGPVVLV